MPTYEYACANCEHTFEEYQSITAPALRKCPACGKLKLQRLIGTGGGVIFRGSGFYQTDYRSESYKKAAEAEKSGGSDKKPTSDDKKTTSPGKSDKQPKQASGGEKAA